nr:ribokinase [Feifania hominis]
MPAVGETVPGHRLYESGGGKGVNQAYAAQYEGAEVEIVGRVGDDPAGRMCFTECERVGVGCRYVQIDPETPTGAGAILSDDAGNNEIVIVPGASDKFCPQDFEAARAYIETCKIGGFQFEVNPETVAYAIRETHRMGIETFLDPSPVVPFDEELYRSLTYIKPNEHEASLLTGIPVSDVASAAQAGRWFLDRGVNRAAIITLGAQGCVLVTRDGHRHYPAPEVPVLDTGCAGDTFAGSFIAAVAGGCSLEEAVRRASCLSALIVSRPGAMLTNFFNSDNDLAAIRANYHP